MDVYEKKLIGGLISGVVSPSAVNLDPCDLSEMGDCLRVCQQLENEKVPITPDLVAFRLSESDGFYSAADFEQMADSARSASMVYEAAEKIKGRALKAFLQTEISNIAADDTRTGAVMLDSLKELVAKADKHYRTSENNFVMLRDIVPKLQAVYKDLYEGVSYAVPCGFDIIDAEILDGFSKGDLHILVGFTGQGKSALALNFARFQARENHVVGVVSREMSDIENAIRLQSSSQNIPRWQISKGMRTPMYEQLNRGLEDLAKLPIAFDIRTADVESLRTQAARMVEQYEMKILYVDYLQLLGSSKQRSRAEEIAAVSRCLKLIAMENNIPVVALCQFNRSAVAATVFDLLTHLKESSGIEQDASTILYIQIEKNEKPEDWRSAQLQVLKNRNGRTFNPVELHYHGPTFTFYTEKPDEQQNTQSFTRLPANGSRF